MLTFYIEIQPGSDNWVSIHKAMVDRAEIRTECQADYHCFCGCGYVGSHRFAERLYDTINTDIPLTGGITWWPDPGDVVTQLNSRPDNWSRGPSATWEPSTVDLVSWSGHSWGVTKLHFFVDDGAGGYTCHHLPRSDIDVRDIDADWVIFDTCWFLDGTVSELKNDLLSQTDPLAREPHMFLGFDDPGEMTHWDSYDCGKYFKEFLRRPGMSVKQAWFDYCKYYQRSGTVAKIFAPDYCMNESLAGSGPILIERDPTPSSNWQKDTYPKP